MNAQEILHALDAVDEDLLNEADQLRTAPGKKKTSPYIGLAVAACLCLLCIGAWFLARNIDTKPSHADVQLMQPSTKHTDSSTNSSEPTSVLPSDSTLLWTPYYNLATQEIGEALKQDVYLFSTELTAQELQSFTPSQTPAWFSPEGYGIFYGNGKLRYIYLVGITSLPETAVTITIGTEEPFYCYVLPNEPQASYCNGVEYTLTRYTDPNGGVALYGEAKLNDCYYTFSLQGTQDTIEQNEADFALILQAFAESDISTEDLAAVKPREIPEILDDTLSHEEALALEPYGSFFLTEIPDGFSEESIRHYQDPYNAYLSGLWTRGYDELSWHVSAFTEQDELRLTHAEDTERYDLSIYPIPRADSVPEALREVVDNPIFYAEELTPELIWSRAYKTGEQGDSDGWRMSFSVLYGDMVIKIRSKGVDPDWIYEQLCNISP